MPDSDKGGTTRPRMTIEATAREIGRKGAKEAKPKRRRAGAKTEPAPAKDESPSPQAEPRPDGTAAAQSSPFDRLRAVLAAAAGTPAKTAAAAAIAAVIAVFAIFAAMRYASETTRQGLAELVGGGAAREDAGQLAAEVAALAGEVEAVKASAALAGLDRRLAGSEAQLAALRSEIDRLAGAQATERERTDEAHSSADDRLTRLEERISALDEAGVAVATSVDELRREFGAAADAGTSAAAVATRVAQEAARIDGLAGRVSGVEQTLSLANGTARTAREASERVAARQAAIERRLDVVEGDLHGQVERISEGLGGRLDRLEASLSALRASVDRLGTPGAIAVHSALAAKAQAGQPFGRELTALRSDLGELEQITALAPYADRAVPTIGNLAARLTGLPATADTDGPAAAPAGDGFLSRLLERAGDAVTVRRRGGGGSAEIGDAAADRLAAGDISGAIAIVGSLPATPERDGWIADAEARRALDDAVEALGAVLDARLTVPGRD